MVLGFVSPTPCEREGINSCPTGSEHPLERVLHAFTANKAGNGSGVLLHLFIAEAAADQFVLEELQQLTQSFPQGHLQRSFPTERKDAAKASFNVIAQRILDEFFRQCVQDRPEEELDGGTNTPEC